MKGNAIHLDYPSNRLLNAAVVDNTSSAIKVQTLITQRVDRATDQSTTTHPPTTSAIHGHLTVGEAVVTSQMPVYFFSFQLASLCSRIAKLNVNKQRGKHRQTRIGCEQTGFTDQWASNIVNVIAVIFVSFSRSLIQNLSISYFDKYSDYWRGNINVINFGRIYFPLWFITDQFSDQRYELYNVQVKV